MLRLGLTGSIATGKSTVLEMFRDLRIPVFSADAAVHGLYSGRGAAAVEALFPGVVSEGVVDRRELSARLLADPGRLHELETLIHPLVREEIAAFLARHEADGAPLAVVDIPLLFETGFHHGLDAIAVTLCPPEMQRARALMRPGMTVDKLNTILARQMPQEDKVKRADYVIDTSGSLEATRRQVRALADTLSAGAQ